MMIYKVKHKDNKELPGSLQNKKTDRGGKEKGEREINMLPVLFQK